jgi:hypothetical protein
MTSIDGVQPVVVHVGPCRCIGRADTPVHPDGDEVYLAPEASMTCGLRANGAITASGGDISLLEPLMARIFIDEGIVGWTFVDEDGDPVPVTHGSIERLLPWGHGGSLVSERANDLYSGAILDPLVRRWSATQRPGPTGDSTSAISSSRRPRRSSSKSSSPEPSETPA